MRAKSLSKEVQQRIAQEYKSSTAPKLAEKYSCTLNQVYEVGKRFKITNRINQKVNITDKQEQIILGGLMGDGRIKRNGKSNSYYSECHERGEADYLMWKYYELGDLTKSSTVYTKDDGRVKDNALEFTTKTTPSLNKYLGLTHEEIIPRMNELALIVYLLDDGWLSGNNRPNYLGHLVLTAYPLSVKERKMIIKQWKDQTGIEFHDVGIKRVDIASTVEYTKQLFDLATSYMPVSTDIIQKKFAGVLSNV